MNRNEKIKKLANAIRSYRGKYHPTKNYWITPPKPSALRNVAAGIERLGLDPKATIDAIHGFKTFGELRNWLTDLGNRVH